VTSLTLVGGSQAGCISEGLDTLTILWMVSMRTRHGAPLPHPLCCNGLFCHTVHIKIWDLVENGTGRDSLVR
jgi:hypothetical protein